ncbi:RDD family protein [Cellulomonas sp. HZM]|uniref:RDD family protein n=1 Tax=Cellulomonas sp. HZM TaxID=1454010 RepID=UPI0018CC319F|nr:RDD family protein [Cellulomonas sp. HZM]
MSTRDNMGSWLEGGPTDERGPGTRLGLPPEGPGSLARTGRRVLALLIDWVACLAISAAFFHGGAPSGVWLTSGSPTATLIIFAAENFLFVAALGHSLGHRVLGLRVRPVVIERDGDGRAEPDDGRAPGFGRALVRTVLLCLVIPAVVWDSDGRGMHDRVAGTAIVRR